MSKLTALFWAGFFAACIGIVWAVAYIGGAPRRKLAEEAAQKEEAAPKPNPGPKLPPEREPPEQGDWVVLADGTETKVLAVEPSPEGTKVVVWKSGERKPTRVLLRDTEPSPHTDGGV